MTISVDAVYEGGVLKPLTVLPLKEHEQVQITIEPKESLAGKTAGMLPWSSDSKSLRRLAEDPEFGVAEST